MYVLYMYVFTNRIYPCEDHLHTVSTGPHYFYFPIADQILIYFEND